MKIDPSARLFLLLVGAVYLVGQLGTGCAIAQADEPDVDATRIDFQNDLIPVFTKNGCNAGACHGAAIGRGGFKLSLYGGDATADFAAVARELHGRRINLINPADSLLVLKPTEQMEHGGGQVIQWDSESADRIVQWIRQGATFTSKTRLRSVDVSPRTLIANEVGEVLDLKTLAHFSNGTSRDVTRWTIFQPEDASAIQIDPRTAKATVLRRGRHVIVARYLSEVVPIEILVPLSESPFDADDQVRGNLVDIEISALLRTLRLPISAAADDDALRRRLALDLTGRLPTRRNVSVPFDRDVLIDELMASAEFTQYWTHWFAQRLRIRPQPNDDRGAAAYYEWLAGEIAADRSYKQFAQQLITATGDTHQYGPANFYRTVGGPREQAEFYSEWFLGSRLRCANCHNHPLDRWTQDDYHGLAAIFAKVDQAKIVRSKPGGEVIHPQTGLPAKPRIPGTNYPEHFLDSEIANGVSTLASWTTSPNNPTFAKAIVNRLWKQMLGRGLVEPVDDFRATNPATHPELLNQLANDFIAHGYSLRHTLRRIASSEAYGRTADATKRNKNDDRFYSHALRRPLEPEVLADAISDVLGLPDRYGEHPAGTRAIELRNPKTDSTSLEILGRCDRQTTCETAAPTGSLPQKLHFLNGPLLNARIDAPGSRLRRMLSENHSPIEIVKRYYVIALGRPAKANEVAHWDTTINPLKTEQERREFLIDFVWGLLTCEEFTTNH